MNTKKVIWRVLFAILWICIGGGMLTLLVAAISKKNQSLCSEYNITIKSSGDNFFIDKNDISQILIKEAGTDIVGRKTSEINLRQLEKSLKNNIWISNAEMWFDNRDKLWVVVTEREPVARIFTTTGNSFYIDSNEIMMPLSDKMSARVPVFTDFPEKKLMNEKDSVLLGDVKKTALFILNNPFWMSQVSQIDINAEGLFEMIPVVGNHLVKLGNGTDIDKKFNRLMALYNQVLSKNGFDIYSTIDLQYKDQVIGVKRGTEKTTIDSVKLRMNVENLLKLSQQLQPDTTDVVKPTVEKQTIIADTVKTNQTKSETVNSGTNSRAKEKTKSAIKESEIKTDINKPKAVMPKKNQQQ